MKIPERFDNMRSLEDSEVREAVLTLLRDPEFKEVIRKLVKGVPIWVHKLYTRRFKTVSSFQMGVIRPFLNKIIADNSTGFTNDFSALPAGRENFIFLSNHRDIVLDPALLSYILLKSGKKIGRNRHRQQPAFPPLG
jgi:hypothetical protein